MAGVRGIRNADQCIRPLEDIGYSHWAENPTPNRMLFVKFVDAKRTSRTHNLHVMEVGGDNWKDRLVFRDRLRSHPDSTREYARLIYGLAERFCDDREEYTAARTDFISAVVVRAKSRNHGNAEQLVRSRETHVSFRAVLSKV